MGGWFGSARPEKCVECGRSVILWLSTGRCDLCEADAFDSAMMRQHSWYVPLGPQLRALAAAQGEVTPC